MASTWSVSESSYETAPRCVAADSKPRSTVVFAETAACTSEESRGSALTVSKRDTPVPRSSCMVSPSAFTAQSIRPGKSSSSASKNMSLLISNSFSSTETTSACEIALLTASTRYSSTLSKIGLFGLTSPRETRRKCANSCAIPRDRFGSGYDGLYLMVHPSVVGMTASRGTSDDLLIEILLPGRENAGNTWSRSASNLKLLPILPNVLALHPHAAGTQDSRAIVASG